MVEVYQQKSIVSHARADLVYTASGLPWKHNNYKYLKTLSVHLFLVFVIHFSSCLYICIYSFKLLIHATNILTFDKQIYIFLSHREKEALE